jgi:hypothetical protein
MSDRLRLYPRRTKWILAVLGSGVFNAAGIAMIAGGNRSGFFVAGFFGLCFVAGFVSLWPSSSYLELDSEGFVIRNLFQETRSPWSDIESFSVRRIGLRRMVGITFAPHYAPLAKSRAAVRSVVGVEGSFPDTYGRSADELARLLNEYLEKCTSRTPSR